MELWLKILWRKNSYSNGKSINEIAHLMGIKTVAEYVENQEIFETIKTIGVDYAQGYGISKPCPLKIW